MNEADRDKDVAFNNRWLARPLVPNRVCCTQFIRFRSLGYKQCVQCGRRYAWDLEPGQLPLITSSRDKGL